MKRFEMTGSGNNVSSDLLNRLMKVSHEIYPQGDYKRIIISDLIRKQLSTLSKLSGDLSENLSQITENEELRYSWSNLHEPTPENEIPF
jgi:DNA helicase TIP49 (TBP-interacting protein)